MTGLTEYGTAFSQKASYIIFNKEYPIFSSKNIKIYKTGRLILMKKERSQFSSSYLFLSGIDSTTVALIEIYTFAVYCTLNSSIKHILFGNHPINTIAS